MAISVATVIGCGLFVANIYKNKQGSQMKDASPFELLNTYKAVVEEHARASEHAKYILTHPGDKECIVRATIHQKLQGKGL